MTDTMVGLRILALVLLLRVVNSCSGSNSPAILLDLLKSCDLVEHTPKCGVKLFTLTNI